MSKDKEPRISPGSPADTLKLFRIDDSDSWLTTNQGTPLSDNQHSLKQGERGPTLLEDFILREKIMHFDHERIPERVVHARGSAAHGHFELLESLGDYTCASFLQVPGTRTPVFVRFSTVAGGSSSADLARDARGFAVKFYTDTGVFDLVGNNIPVFFIQDAMKFPDLVHAVKTEPHNGMPQAASAHDTFWDFASLKTESTHMLMWVMSDRAIPRSFRMMQGFGIHTFRFVTAKGESSFVKFHWRPLYGTYSVLWDEAVKINGADPDFHRRDLWESIEQGKHPEWRLGVQIFTEEQAEQWPFDILDPTKLIPEELVPVREIGRLVLDRNPDNFFAETEQVAFHPGHVVPGIDFSNDPLLQGRLFSYLDTQLTRLGSPNFHEIPINRPHCPVHNNQRDGHMRQTINKGRVSYEPNSLAGGCPMQMGARGFVSFPQPAEGRKVRADPERFSDHFSQARLFWRSQSDVEQSHIVNAFSFELSKVETPAIRHRMVANLAQVDGTLAARVADGIGIPHPPHYKTPDVLPPSPALSLFAHPSELGIRGRRIGILIADGVEERGVTALKNTLECVGAAVKLIAPTLKPVHSVNRGDVPIDAALATSPSLLYDAIVVGGGDAALAALRSMPHALEFVRDAYLHCKTIAYFPGGESLLHAAGLPPDLQGVAGIIALSPALEPKETEDLTIAISSHRHWSRESSLSA